MIEDNRRNLKDYQATTCYFGHFKNDRDFVLYHHKEFEVKGISLGLYFNGRIEDDDRGCRIEGSIAKKFTANLFLGMGAALCLAALFGAAAKQDLQVTIVASVLLIIILGVYIVKPKKEQEMLMKELEKISFDDKFYKVKHRKAEAKKAAKKKHSISDFARMNGESQDEV